MQADRAVLWVMPALQMGLLFFFVAVAILHFWYNWWLLVPCFITGWLPSTLLTVQCILISRSTSCCCTVRTCLEEVSEQVHAGC